MPGPPCNEPAIIGGRCSAPIWELAASAEPIGCFGIQTAPSQRRVACMLRLWSHCHGALMSEEREHTQAKMEPVEYSVSCIKAHDAGDKPTR